MTDIRCTYCLQWGHRASHCPRRPQAPQAPIEPAAGAGSTEPAAPAVAPKPLEM